VTSRKYMTKISLHVSRVCVFCHFKKHFF